MKKLKRKSSFTSYHSFETPAISGETGVEDDLVGAVFDEGDGRDVFEVLSIPVRCRNNASRIQKCDPSPTRINRGSGFAPSLPLWNPIPRVWAEGTRCGSDGKQKRQKNESSHLEEGQLK